MHNYEFSKSTFKSLKILHSKIKKRLVWSKISKFEEMVLETFISSFLSHKLQNHRSKILRIVEVKMWKSLIV